MKWVFAVLLSLRSATAAIGDACPEVGAPCVFPTGISKGDIVVAHGRQLQRDNLRHGRQLQQFNVRCNAAKVCVDTTGKVEISPGIWMPEINLGTWFVYAFENMIQGKKVNSYITNITFAWCMLEAVVRCHLWD